MTKGGNPDKWFVLFGSFVCQLFSSGFANSLGLFYVEFLEAFDTTRVEVGWTTSVCSGLVFGAGLLGGIIVHRFGTRKSAIAGGTISFVGLFASSFTPSFAVLYVTFGMIGFGCCLTCVSSVVAVGQHFTKGRGAASALAVVGTGVGALLFPFIIRALIDHFGWRGAMMILSGLLLNTVPASCMFRQKDADNKTPSYSLKKAMCSSAIRNNAAYICYLLVCPIAGIGYKYTYIVIVDLGMLLGFSKALSSYLLVYISLANALSTVCFGLLLRFVRGHNILFLNCCWLVMSGVMFIFPQLKTYPAVITGAVVYGAAIGGNIALYAVIVADLVGLKYYSTALGFTCTSYGIGYMLSAPMAGLINDATGSYTISFYIAGSLCVFSVVVFTAVLQITKLCKHRPREDNFEVEVMRGDAQFPPDKA